jgi:L-amino acid N-acyltransferase YncA
MYPSMFSVRNATEADLPEIVAITNQAIIQTTAMWSLHPVTLQARQTWMRERLARGFPVIVAEENQVVLGFASFGDFRAFDGYLHTVEHSLYVTPPAQGKGLGRALLSALIVRARTLNIHVMVAGIDDTNTASIALHQQLGFEDGGCLRQVGRKFDRWLDLRFMQKRLSDE